MTAAAIRQRCFVAYLHLVRAWDRLRLRLLCARHPGLQIHPEASSNLAVARYVLAPGARLRIGPGVVTERIPGALCFALEAGAVVEVGAGGWLRTEAAPVHLVAFADATLRVGPEAFLNGCYLSAKRHVELGRRAWIGMGTRVFDADQHDLDADTPEISQPVHIGDHVWIASDCTVLRGVTIGEHVVVGTRSLVSRDVPPHTLAYGSPARPQGTIGDRSRTR